MDKICRERREIFFTNLLLLGMDKDEMEKKYLIPINMDMFNVPNKKGFEVITHFLLNRLNAITSEDFSVIWPLCDKNQDREFRKTCYKHFLEMAKDENCPVRFPMICQTIFYSPGGDRFYELYFAITSYILFKDIVKDDMVVPLYRATVTPQNYKLVKGIIQSATITSTTDFKCIQACHSRFEQFWKAKAEILLQHYRKTKEKIRKHETEIKKFFSSLSISSEDDKRSDQQIFISLNEKCGQKLEKLLGSCQVLEKHLSKEPALWDSIRTELDSEKVKKISFDGHTFPQELPNMMQTDFGKMLEERGIQTVIEDEKLSVQKVLGLVCTSLEYYKQHFKEVNFQSFEEMLERLGKVHKKLQDTFCSSKALSDEIQRKLVPDLDNSVQQMPFHIEEENPYKFATNVSDLHFSSAWEPEDLPALESAMRLIPPTDEELLECEKELLNQKTSSDVSSAIQDHEAHNGVSNCENTFSMFTPAWKLQGTAHHEDDASLQNGFSKQSDRFSNTDTYEKQDVCSEPDRDENVRTCIEEFEKSLSVSKDCRREELPMKDFTDAAIGWNDKFERVKSHYAKQLVRRVLELSNGTDLSIPQDKYYSPDFMDEKVFDHKDKLVRTPIVSRQKIPSSLDSSCFGKKDSELVMDNSDQIGNLYIPEISFEDEEQLCDISMPCIPDL